MQIVGARNEKGRNLGARIILRESFGRIYGAKLNSDN